MRRESKVLRVCRVSAVVSGSVAVCVVAVNKIPRSGLSLEDASWCGPVCWVRVLLFRSSNPTDSHGSQTGTLGGRACIQTECTLPLMHFVRFPCLLSALNVPS